MRVCWLVEDGGAWAKMVSGRHVEMVTGSNGRRPNMIKSVQQIRRNHMQEGGKSGWGERGWLEDDDCHDGEVTTMLASRSDPCRACDGIEATCWTWRSIKSCPPKHITTTGQFPQMNFNPFPRIVSKWATTKETALSQSCLQHTNCSTSAGCTHHCDRLDNRPASR